MKTFKIEQMVFVIAERKNTLVKAATVGAPNVKEALECFAGGSDHVSFRRLPRYDAQGWMCFVSELGHTFMVHENECSHAHKTEALHEGQLLVQCDDCSDILN